MQTHFASTLSFALQPQQLLSETKIYLLKRCTYHKAELVLKGYKVLECRNLYLCHSKNNHGVLKWTKLVK